MENKGKKTTKVTLDQAKKSKGKTNFAKLLGEQNKERKVSKNHRN